MEQGNEQKKKGVKNNLLAGNGKEMAIEKFKL
jgi:hypothetical protein